MNVVNLCLSGFGNVGRHFVQLLYERGNQIKKDYAIEFNLVAVADLSGGILSDQPIDLVKLLEYNYKVPWAEAFRGSGRDDLESEQIISQAGANILLEATPTNLETGEPGLANIKTAFNAGMSVATLAKGPLVVDYAGLRALAAQKGKVLKFSGATAAALPALDVAQYCLAGSTIRRIIGILNGTSNYILTRMATEGISYDIALSEAKKMGVAETKPDLDVNGWDTAAKILILTNAIYDTNLSLHDISVTGITSIDLSVLKDSARRGKVVKLVGESKLTGRAVRGKGKKSEVAINVRPMELDVGHVLAQVKGTNKAVYYETDTLGDLLISGGKSDPRAAAAAALKDVINIVQGR